MNTLKLKDGRHLSFEQYGAENGIPVIFQNGFGDSRLARHPDNNLTIEAGVRLITVDRPGYGESSPHPGRTFLNWVPDIEQLANQLKIDKFGVMSHSGGSPYALAIAYKLKDSPEPDKILFTNQALRKMFEDGMKEAFKQGEAGWVGDVFAGINWGFTPEEIQSPVKIFNGSADELLFAEMGRRLAQQLPHADFPLYEGEGHYCLYKHWSEILNTFTQANTL